MCLHICIYTSFFCLHADNVTEKNFSALAEAPVASGSSTYGLVHGLAVGEASTFDYIWEIRRSFLTTCYLVLSHTSHTTDASI